MGGQPDTSDWETDILCLHHLIRDFKKGKYGIIAIMGTVVKNNSLGSKTYSDRQSILSRLMIFNGSSYIEIEMDNQNKFGKGHVV
jgi:hypothetical protein